MRRARRGARGRRPRVRVEDGPGGRQLMVDENFASLYRADGPATVAD